MKKRIAVISTIFIALHTGLVTTPAWALTATEAQKLFARDGAEGDFFGGSVAMDGDTAVIGAWSNDSDNVVNSGAAYVFKRTGRGWRQQAKLTASDGAEGEFFGSGGVAVDGDTAVIGAFRGDGNAVDSGGAYVFVYTGRGWRQQAKLIASDGAFDDRFGGGVAVDGDTAVIGASGADAAYVFVRHGTRWRQQAKLTASDDSADFDAFGISVAVDGRTAVIGAAAGNGNVIDSGAAYVFKRTGTGWHQQAKLIASEGADGDFFGTTVAVDDNTAVIAAAFGGPYVFVRHRMRWHQQARLTTSDGAEIDCFGCGVALDDNTTVIGADLNDGNAVHSGAAYVFERTGTSWSQRDKLTASDGAADDLFGYSVALDDDTAMIGALAGDGSVVDSGSAYVFSLVAPVDGSVGGTVTGINSQTIRCENRETQQRVSVPLPDNGSWNCEDAGLVFDTGDRIKQRITGIADGTTDVGGTVTGVSSTTVRCDNTSTGRGVFFDLNGGSSWDCEAAGLQVRTGDSIIQSVLGTAD